MDATLLGQTCSCRFRGMLALVASCWVLLDVVVHSLKLVKLSVHQVEHSFCSVIGEA